MGNRVSISISSSPSPSSQEQIGSRGERWGRVRQVTGKTVKKEQIAIGESTDGTELDR
jgi:hypothetical protein